MQLLDQAQSDFQQAIQIDPSYARGYAGLGSVQYLQSLASVDALQSYDEISTHTLDVMEQTYEQALRCSLGA